MPAVSRRTRTNPGVCPPLPHTGLRLGRSLERLGVDRRPFHDVIFLRERQGMAILIAVVHPASTLNRFKIMKRLILFAAWFPLLLSCGGGTEPHRVTRQIAFA